jgi:polyhydroxybutyrate depolymerase
MSYHLARILPTFFTLLFTGCANLPSPENLVRGESYVVNMDAGTGGWQRSYRVHIPADYVAGEARPLVVIVHGAFSSSKSMEKESGFSALADREGFIAVYPDGIGIFGLLQHWNAGHCCGKAAADNVDDVGFIARVIEHVMGYTTVNGNRIYMVGYSNGAMLTHRFAAERPELLAAAAPLAGAIGSATGPNALQWQMPDAPPGLPIIMIHGLRDQTIPYGPAAPGDPSTARRYSSVDDASRYWSSRNGCAQHDRSHDTPNTGVSVDTWSDCDKNATVQLLTLTDWGHRWPGDYFTGRAGPKGAYYGFDAAKIIWSFFQRHTRARWDV